MRSRRFLLVALGALALLASACGGDDQRVGADRTTPPTVATTAVKTTAETMKDHASTTAASTGGMAVHFTIVAKSVAFSPSKIGHVKAGDEISITFDNQDANVPHNIHFAAPIDKKTDVKTGPDKDELKFKAPKAGTYDFTCDVHPTMKGELTVD